MNPPRSSSGRARPAPVRFRTETGASPEPPPTSCRRAPGGSSPQGSGFLIQDAGWGWGPASMARPYSTDLRDRVVGSVALGRSCRATAALFGVSAASVVKWCQRWRATGSAAAYRMGGRKRLAAKPDLTLRGLQAELAARGIAVSYSAVWNFFAAEGISFKKKPARQRT